VESDTAAGVGGWDVGVWAFGDTHMTPLVQDSHWGPPPTRVTPKPVKRFLDHLFVECGLAGNTVSAYQNDLCAFWEDLDANGSIPIDLDIGHVQRHLIALRQRGLGTSSIARHLSSIKMFLRYEHQRGMLRRDVASLIDMPKKWTRIPKSIHYDHMEALLNAPVDTDEFYHRDKAMLELLYATGMRVSEMTGLVIDNVNLDIGYLRCMGKGRRERIIPIGRPAIHALKAYLRKLRPALETTSSGRSVFLSRTGRPMDRTNVWRLVRKYARRAGIEHSLHPHTIRHSFATDMLAGGADLRVVQELLGHVDVTTTQVYLHVDQARLKQVHQQYHPRQ